MRRILTSTTVKVLAIVFGAIFLLVAGLAVGSVFTQLGFNDERAKMKSLQQEVSSLEEELETAGVSEAELEEATARAEEAEAKADDLQVANNSLEERINELKDSMQNASATPTQESGLAQDYVSWKFWIDGNQYRATDEGTVFYSDPEYKNGLETSEVILVSRVVSPDKIEKDGEIVTVYTALSTNGFVYCRETPNLEIVQ